MVYNFVKASFAMACLATTALAPAAAQSKDMDMYFYPKYKWSVTQTTPANGTTPATCSVMSELNNGYLVEFDGTLNGLKHLNIDFRQDVFDKGLRYEVQYSVPGASNTIVYSTAVEKNKLQGDLINNSSFAEHLKTASAMDVRIRNNEFRIYLNGLSAALDEYNDCVSPAQAMASAPIEPTATTTEITKEQETVAKSMPQQPVLPTDTALAPPPPLKTSLIDEVSEVPEDRALSQEQLRPAPNERPRYTEQIAKQMKEESEKYKPEPREIPTENAATQIPAENIEPEANKQVTSASKMAKAEDLAPLQSPPKATKNAVENYKTPDPVYNVTRNEEPIVADFTKPKAEVVPKNAALEAQQKSAAKTMPQDNDFAAIQPANGDHSDDFVMMRNKISDLEKQLSLTMRKNKMLDEELKGALRDSEQEKLSVSSDNWNLELATMKYNEAERQIMRLGRKLQTQKSQCEHEKTELENMLFDPRLTNQQQLAKLSSLESELDKAQSDLLRQQRVYEERIRILEEQLAQ